MRIFLETESHQIVILFLRQLYIVTWLIKMTDFPIISILLFILSLRQAWYFQLRHLLRICISCSRISTTYPLGYSPFLNRGTPLGPTNPPLTYIAEETLGFRRQAFSAWSRYSYRHSHFYPLHHALQHSFTADKTLPYHTRALRENDKLLITND